MTTDIARTPERGTSEALRIRIESVGVRVLSREDLRNAVGLVSSKDNEMFPFGYLLVYGFLFIRTGFGSGIGIGGERLICSLYVF